MQKLTLNAKGLFTFPNQISQVPSGSLIQAANVVIDREGVVESRRGYNTLPGTLGTDTSNRAWQVFRYTSNLISHYGPLAVPNKLAFYSPETTFTGILTSGSPTITNVSSTNGLYVGQTISPTIIEQPLIGDLLEGSNTILNVVTTLGLYVGQLIGGIGIPLNTTISSITGSGPYTITMSANSTYTKTNSSILAINRNILGFAPDTTVIGIGSGTVTLSGNANVSTRTENFNPTDVDLGHNLINISLNGLTNGQDVQFTTTGTLPSGLSLNQNYFIINVTDDTFQVSLTSGGSAVALTTQGTGVHTLVITNSIQSYGWIDYSGNYLQPDSVTKMRSVESNSNVYFTTSTGVYKLDSITDTIVESGAPGGLDGFATLDAAQSGFMPDNVQVAYRIVWGYKDLNKNVILGAPSQRIEIANNSGESKNVDLNITIPAMVTTAYFYQVYRSGFSSDANTPANDEMSLVYESNPSATDILNKFVTVLDETPESLRNGAALYTSPSQEGILQENTQPPYCKDMTLFKGSVFYANTQSKQNMTLSMLAASGQFQFFGDTTSGSTTIANLAYTVTGDLTTGSNTISNIPSTASLTTGQLIYDVTNPGFLPNDPTNNNITVITQVVDANTIIVSNPSAGTSTGDTLQIGVIGVEVGQIITAPGVLSPGTTITEVYTPITLTGNVTNGSPVVTNIPSTLTLAVGQPVTGPGIPSGTTILSIDSGTQVTLTNNVNLTFTGDLTATMNTVNNVSNTSFLVVDQEITDVSNPSYLPADTFITNISGTTLTLNNSSSNTSIGDTLLAAATVDPFSMTGNTVSGTNVVSGIVISGSSILAVGQTISDNTSTGNFPIGTTVTSIIDSATITVSNNAAVSATGDTFTVAPFLPPLTFEGGIQIFSPALTTSSGATITAQNGTGGVEIGDTITIAGITYTAATTENIAAKQFKVFAQGSPAQNISDTAQSLIRVINRTTGPTPTIYATYLSGFNDLPGKIYFEERVFGGGIFYATASSTRAGQAWSPNLPTSGTSVASDNDTFANGLYYSKTQIPEAVPIVNFIQIGSAYANILRVIALRDSLFILKEDGVFRLTGQDPTSFQVDLFDSTTQIVSAESAVSLNNLIFCLSKYGIVTISDTGVTVISRAIEDLMLNLLDLNITSAKNLSFGISYESDRKYIFFCITNLNDQYATQAYVYNTFTQTWTQWVLNQTCGIVHPIEDKIYLGDAVSNTFDIERKTRTFTDYTDSSFPVNLVGITGTTTLGSPEITSIPNTDNLQLGQSIAGIGIPTGALIIDKTTGVVTINMNATSSGTTTLLLDGGKTLILDSLNDVDVGDVLYQTDGRYSIITAVNTITGTVTVKDFINDWVLGSSFIYKAYQSIVQYVPQTAANPGSIKQFREATLLFQVPFFNQLTIDFNTDLSSGNESVLLNGLYGMQWGRFPWGGIPWGGTVKAFPIRTYVPQQKQRCSLMNVTVTHQEAYAYYRLNGISFVHNNLSERVGK